MKTRSIERDTNLWAGGLLLLYAAAIFPSLRQNHFDPSIFIDATAQYVDESKTPSPVRVRPAGYDGIFYYRMAMDLFGREQYANGVSFDHGPYRMKRVGYPLIAKVLALSDPEKSQPLS